MEFVDLEPGMVSKMFPEEITMLASDTVDAIYTTRDSHNTLEIILNRMGRASATVLLIADLL